ncbi:MAG: ribosome recycling factor, partial [Dethiobacteria bacterium]
MDDIYVEFEERMKKSVANMKREFLTLRAGRATPALVENLEVDYYGTPTPLNQLAGITVPEPRLIVIQTWDKGAIKDVEK